MKKLIEQYVGLSNIKIEKIETNLKGHIEITVKSTLQGTGYHCC